MLKLNSSIARMRKLYGEIKKVYPRRVIELVKLQLNRGEYSIDNSRRESLDPTITKHCAFMHLKPNVCKEKTCM